MNPRSMPTPQPNRRTLLKTATWSVPAVAVASSAPAFATSPLPVFTIEGMSQAIAEGGSDLALYPWFSFSDRPKTSVVGVVVTIEFTGDFTGYDYTSQGQTTSYQGVTEYSRFGYDTAEWTVSRTGTGADRKTTFVVTAPHAITGSGRHSIRQYFMINTKSARPMKGTITITPSAPGYQSVPVVWTVD